MSAIFLAMPLSVMIGALAAIRRGRTDRHRSPLVPVQHMPTNNMQPMCAGKRIGRVVRPRCQANL
jgi:hypothetical protein